MSNISSSDAWPVKSMRWVARFLSIPWVFWALFVTWFLVGDSYFAGEISLAVSIIITIIAALMFLGAAIIASVWGKEAFGGGVLLVDGALIIVFLIVEVRPTIEEFLTPSDPLGFVMVLPPLVAGSLFLICHRRSKTSGERHV